MSQGFATSLILTGWTEVAGSAISAIATPVRIAYGPGGATLILRVFGPRAQEVGMTVHRLIERINACYGYKAIDSIRITQVGTATEDLEQQAKPAFKPSEPSTEDLARIRSSVEDIEDDGLRNLLLELGKSVLSRPK